MKLLSIPLAFAAILIAVSAVQAQSVKIKERTKFYSITGKTAPEFARAMTKRGPYSRQHRRRAWATAARSMTYQLTRQKTARGCKLVDAAVALKITYNLPKLRNERSLSARQRKKWRKMYALLEKHERVHGRFYKEFARDAHRKLLRLPTGSNCRALDRSAAKLVKRLSAKDSARNDRFDRNDGRNYSRMRRIYTSS